MAKVIIVEDDPMISEIYQRKFVEAGFEIMAATTGEQVLELAKNNKVDLILLDLIMPKMDGFEVIEKMRGGDYDKEIKIIVSSNLSQREDREKALNLGADGFVEKAAYTPSELVAEVKKLLHQFAQRKKNEERLRREASNLPEDPNIKKKRILLIEDEEIFLEMFGEKLRQDGFEVVGAKNGAWGIKEAMQQDFDLFIIDAIMPAMSGKEVVEKIKAEERLKNIPIIVVSASVEDRVGREMRAMGINCFFTKTKIIPSELSLKAQELLGIADVIN
jgi:DNA-binding response OmpR family regulator